LIGTIASGDSFVSKKNIHKFNLSNNIDVVDMESCAIAQVCHNMKIKYGFIKLVSDIVKKDESQSKQ
jgi:nucleoside phosphorylase